MWARCFIIPLIYIYGTHSFEMWKTRHKISVDIRIILQRAVDRRRRDDPTGVTRSDSVARSLCCDRGDAVTGRARGLHNGDTAVGPYKLSRNSANDRSSGDEAVIEVQ